MPSPAYSSNNNNSNTDGGRGRGGNGGGGSGGQSSNAIPQSQQSSSKSKVARSRSLTKPERHRPKPGMLNRTPSQKAKEVADYQRANESTGNLIESQALDGNGTSRDWEEVEVEVGHYNTLLQPLHQQHRNSTKNAFDSSKRTNPVRVLVDSQLYAALSALVTTRANSNNLRPSDAPRRLREPRRS
ncbi:hypothetical protein BGX24_009015 [Mortierella sp. AD032]|nr:hypothetical protein BGX24_009015 [Mortierella sp. AD032]